MSKHGQPFLNEKVRVSNNWMSVIAGHPLYCHMNPSLRAGLIFLLLALPSLGYGLDCVQKKNVNAEIEILTKN